MVDFNINEWITFWNQEKFQLEQEIISLSGLRDRLWSQKEFYKQKSILLRERLDREHTVPASPARVSSPKQTTAPVSAEVEGMRTRISGTKKFLGLLIEKISDLSNSLDTEMAPYLVDREKELNLQLDEAHAELQKIRDQKALLEEEFRNYKKASYSQREKSISQDSRMEMELIGTREEMGKLLEKEDRYILEIRRLEGLNQTLAAQHDDLKDREAQISNLKYLLDQGARDYERLQEKMERLLHENKKIRQTALDTDLDRVKLKTKIVGLEKVLKTRDLHHGEELAALLVSKRELDARSENLEDEVQRLSSHLANVNDELEETRGRLDATLYEVSVLKRDLEGAVAAEEVDQLREHNASLALEVEDLTETISLLEQNIEALELRISDDSEPGENLDRSEILSEISNIRGLIDDAFAQEQIRKAIPLSPGSVELYSPEERQREAMVHQLKAELLDSESARQRLELAIALHEDEQKSLEEKLARLEKDLEDALSADIARSLSPEQDAAFTTRIGELEVELEAARKAKAETETLSLEQEQTLKARISELEAELHKSSEPSDGSALRERVGELEMEVDRLETVSQKNSQALANEKSRSVTLENQLQVLTGENKGLHQLVQSLQLNQPVLLDHLSQLEDQVDQLEDSLLLEGDRATASGREIDSLGGSITALLDTLEASIHQKDYEILTLRTEVEALKSGLPLTSVTDSSENDDLKKTISAQEQTIQELSTQLGNLETELLIAQATGTGTGEHAQVSEGQVSPEVKDELTRIADNLEMLGLMQACSDLRALLPKL